MAQTAGGVAIIALNVGHGDRFGITATGLKIVAARAKVASLRPFMGQGEIARYRLEWARIFIGPRQRDRPEQRLCIGVLHLIKNVLDRAAFNRLAGIHHTKPVAGFKHKAKVV